MPMPTFPLARLGAFRAELHGSFTRRADALFELGDALLCSQTPFPSLPHLSLEPTHRRGPLVGAKRSHLQPTGRPLDARHHPLGAPPGY
jgi:hypothetical protein